MANSVDPDQSAPIGAVFSGSTLFASILNSSVMLFATDNFSRQHFQMHFFLGALRVNLEDVFQNPTHKVKIYMNEYYLNY